MAFILRYIKLNYVFENDISQNYSLQHLDVLKGDFLGVKCYSEVEVTCAVGIGTGT